MVHMKLLLYFELESEAYAVSETFYTFILKRVLDHICNPPPPEVYRRPILCTTCHT